jgi:hypothetical protein
MAAEGRWELTLGLKGYSKRRNRIGDACYHSVFVLSPTYIFVIVQVNISVVDGSGQVKSFKRCCKFFLRFRVICNDGDELEIPQQKEIY